MTEKIALITDTISNLPDSYINENGIYLVRLYVVIDDEYFVDGIDIKSSEIYERNEADPNFVSKSSAPSPNDFSEVYKKIKEDGYDKAIFIGIGSNLSSTISNANQAEKYGLDLEIIDSGTITMLEGMLVMYANDLIKSGLSFDEVVQRVKKAQGRPTAYGWVDTLKYLKAGGRLGKTASKVSAALNFKPTISIDGEGKFELFKLKCPKEKSAALIEIKLRESLEGADKYYLTYIHGKDSYIVEGLRESVKDLEAKAIDTMSVEFSPAVAVHAGTKAYAACFLIIDD